jgi:hypothetical protein
VAKNGLAESVQSDSLSACGRDVCERHDGTRNDSAHRGSGPTGLVVIAAIEWGEMGNPKSSLAVGVNQLGVVLTAPRILQSCGWAESGSAYWCARRCSDGSSRLPSRLAAGNRSLSTVLNRSNIVVGDLFPTSLGQETSNCEARFTRGQNPCRIGAGLARARARARRPHHRPASRFRAPHHR